MFPLVVVERFLEISALLIVPWMVKGHKAKIVMKYFGILDCCIKMVKHGEVSQNLGALMALISYEKCGFIYIYIYINEYPPGN